MHSVSKNLQRDEEPGERDPKQRPLQGAFLIPPVLPVVLIPVENLWHYLRAHHWSNRLYRDYDALQEEAVRSLCAVREDTETIKTVCNPRYISRGA